ncbi:SufS family cysteine desulfurase [Neptuniibacter sp.]|uniref:SufS family cysteine desulfurase n=1 Tax=Neptuniibacter sp. TaxID=1962643 RepID=UPI003B5C0EBB
MSDRTLALDHIRAQMPTLLQQVNNSQLIYLDNAATTHKPEAVIQAVDSFYRYHNSNVHRASHALSAEATSRFEAAREQTAKFLNAASAQEIIWTRGTTESINLVANSLGEHFTEGDEILISTMEHHANIVPWQMLAERKKLSIKVIPLSESGDLDSQAFSNLLTEKTRLVAITHVSNALGTINPVKEMIRTAHDAGALVLVDGAQALPHFRVDVKDLDADFYVFSGHKLYAPTGVGVLYGKQHLLESMPPWQGGGEMIKKVSFEKTTYNQLPFKFEAGTPNIAGVIGLGEAINWLSKLDQNLLHEHEQALFDKALDGCSQIKGFSRIGTPQQSVSLLSFTLKGQHQQDIGLMLDKRGIAVRTGHHCAMPLMSHLGLSGTTRASFAFYNTLDEVELFVTALDELNKPEQFHTPVSIHTGLLQQLQHSRGWNERYREIMLAGKSLPSMPQSLKVEANLVNGCESNTWLYHESDRSGNLVFKVDSDARIIRGLLALLMEIFNNKTPEQILAQDIEKLFIELELEKHLSPSRGNGLKAVVERIYKIARQSESA